MGYCLHAVGCHVVGIPISNRLVLPSSVEDLDMMLTNSFSSKEENLSLVSCGICSSFNITDCLLEFMCSSWKPDSGGIVGSSVGLFSCCLVIFLSWSMMHAYCCVFNFKWIQNTKHSCSRNVNSIICDVKYGYTQ